VAGAVPVVLGSDHSVVLPDMTAMAERHGAGAVGVIHLDTHADTAPALWGLELSHGSPMRSVVDNGSIRGDHFLQFGLRGNFPGPSDFDWMRSVGMRWYTTPLHTGFRSHGAGRTETGENEAGPNGDAPREDSNLRHTIR
jgi:arginase family enzyme